jgi:hypothetical protein
MLNSIGCSVREANNGVSYQGQTQLAAAVSFATAHPGQVKLISISIGANDDAPCLNLASPVSCVDGTLSTMESTLRSIARHLRTAVGTSVAIFGLTDVDSDVVDWLNGSQGKSNAEQWLTEFKNVVNPTLASSYANSKVALVNLTADFGSFVPWTKQVRYAPNGRIHLAVARTCQLTWICSSHNQDQHLDFAGNSLMAREISTAYLRCTSQSTRIAPSVRGNARTKTNRFASDFAHLGRRRIRT